MPVSVTGTGFATNAAFQSQIANLSIPNLSISHQRVANQLNGDQSSGDQSNGDQSNGDHLIADQSASSRSSANHFSATRLTAYQSLNNYPLPRWQTAGLHPECYSPQRKNRAMEATDVFYKILGILWILSVVVFYTYMVLVVR